MSTTSSAASLLHPPRISSSEEKKMPAWMRQSFSSAERRPLLPSTCALRQRRYFQTPWNIERKCTDVIAFLLFGAIWIGVMLLTCRGLLINRASWASLHGMDYQGNPCTSVQALYYPDLLHTPSFGVCIDQCPTQENQQLQIPILSGGNTSTLVVQSYSTVPTEGFCKPTSTQLVSSDAWMKAQAHAQPLLADILGEQVWMIVKAWDALLTSAGVALAASAVYLFSLRYCGGCLLPFSIVAVLLGLVISGYAMLHKSMTASSTDHLSLEVGAIGLFSAAGIAFILSMLTIRRVWLAWSFVKYSTRALVQFRNSSFFMLFGYPLISFGLLFLVFGIILLATFGLFSTGVFVTTLEEVTASQTSVSVPVKTFEMQTSARWWILYLLCTLFLSRQAILTVGQMGVSIAMAIWYFDPSVLTSHSDRASSEGTQPIPEAHSTESPNPIHYGFQTAWRYHFGTAVMNAALVSPFKRFRSFMLLVEEQSRQAESSEGAGSSSCCVSLAKLCCCCQWCVDAFLKYINEGVVITAIHGTNFCTSAKLSYELTQTQLLQVGSLTRVGQSATFFGKLLVVSTSAITCWFMLPSGTSPWLPLIITLVFSHSIAHAFMSVYETTINTLLMCFVVDEDIHGGQGQAAYAPYAFTKLIDDHLRSK